MSFPKIFLTLILSLGLFVSETSWAASMSGQVLSVMSGNRITLNLSTGGRRHVQLVGLKPPLAGTDLARTSRRHLHMLLAGKFVQVVYQTVSPQGEIIGRVLLGGADTNRRMLVDGMARLDIELNMDRELLNEYRKAQSDARDRGIGVWRHALY